MNLKFYNLLLFLISLFCLNCSTKESENTVPETLEYSNLIVFSDHSSRLSRSQPNDLIIINTLLDYLVTECIKPGTKVNDRSSFYYSRLNANQSNCGNTKLDLEEINNLSQKQTFVNNTNSNNKNLKNSIDQIKESIKCNYELKGDVGGLDLLSLLYSKIQSGTQIKTKKVLAFENDSTILNYRNHIFIFTDGYLEFNRQTGNPDYYFGENEVSLIRNYCIANRVTPEVAFSRNKNLKLAPLQSSLNKNIELHIMETDDRGYDKLSATFKFTGELSDNNILRTAWQIWAQESGFRNFTWSPLLRENNLISKNLISKILNN